MMIIVNLSRVIGLFLLDVGAVRVIWRPLLQTIATAVLMRTAAEEGLKRGRHKHDCHTQGQEPQPAPGRPLQNSGKDHADSEPIHNGEV
ncbi:MAG: hypothetical protein AB7D07_12025 [Desulfovibrionaceae bacterium]